MVRPTTLNREELANIHRALKLEVSTEIDNINWARKPNLKFRPGAKKDRIKAVLENYNRGDLKSRDARKIIKEMNSKMGRSGEMVLQVYGIKIKQNGSREDLIKRIRDPKVSDFEHSENAQMKMLDKITLRMIQSGGELYLANKQKNREKYLQYLQEEKKEPPGSNV